MIEKTCDDKFEYGCTLSVEVETEEELKNYFYLKNTYTGPYFQNTCKECTKRKRRENYKDNIGSYNWNKKKDRTGVYTNNPIRVGKLD